MAAWPSSATLEHLSTMLLPLSYRDSSCGGSHF